MSDEDWLTNPTAPLRTFSEALGDLAPDWTAREEPKRLHYRCENFSRDVAAGLTLDHLRPLAEAYSDALRCCFLLGDMPVLEVGPNLDETDLDEFRAITEDSPTVVFDFALNKHRLLQTWLGEMPDRCRSFLYLFPGALERLLKIPPSRLRGLEDLLWNTDPAKKVVILVPGHNIWLDGPYLALVGGERVAEWQQVLPQEDPDLTEDDPLRFIVETRASTLKWDQPWVKNLTPLHLNLEGKGDSDDIPIATLLKQHLVNMVILYTADRSLEREGELLAAYVSTQHSVEVPLLKTDQLCLAPTDQGAHALLEIFEWAYVTDFFVDKLPLVQMVVAGALQAVDTDMRCRHLLQNGHAVYDRLKYHWEALIEDKVDAYVTQMRALEDYVGETAQAFADQVTKMIDDLTKNMLAAVGVVVGSFIGSLFKDAFNPAVFSLGMFAYALYLAVFPLAFSMTNRREEYEALKDGFEGRRGRFEALLYRTRVKEIIGDRIRNSQERFEGWFFKVKYAYIILIVLAVVAGIVALVIFGPVSPATTTTSPAATPTVAVP